jgi:hypothetical protein
MKYFKTNFEQNILRQIIFTDRNIIVGIILLSNVILLYVSENLPIEIRGFISLSFTTSFLILLSLKIDEQYVYKLLPNFFRYIVMNKHVRP